MEWNDWANNINKITRDARVIRERQAANQRDLNRLQCQSTLLKFREKILIDYRSQIEEEATAGRCRFHIKSDGKDEFLRDVFRCGEEKDLVRKILSPFNLTSWTEWDEYEQASYFEHIDIIWKQPSN